MATNFAGLCFDLSDEWLDVTAEVENQFPPTLARADGGGALQFSIAVQTGGAPAIIDERALEELLIERCELNGIVGNPTSVVSAVKHCVGLTSSTPTEFIAIWYLSNGRDVAMVTYISSPLSEAKTKREFAEIKRMIKSVQFESDVPGF